MQQEINPKIARTMLAKSIMPTKLVFKCPTYSFSFKRDQFSNLLEILSKILHKYLTNMQMTVVNLCHDSNCRLEYIYTLKKNVHVEDFSKLS